MALSLAHLARACIDSVLRTAHRVGRDVHARRCLRALHHDDSSLALLQRGTKQVSLIDQLPRVEDWEGRVIVTQKVYFFLPEFEPINTI